jgi:hypothetical protein
MAGLDGKLEYGRRKGVMTKSQLRKRRMEDLKHEV